MLTEALTRALVEFAQTLTKDFVATVGMERLMQIVPEELGVDGAGVMLADDEDQLRFVCASDDTVRLIERFQVETGEGPCVMAALTGEIVIASDLRDTGDERFPRFAMKAAQAGLVSVHSFPMQVEDRRIGALNIYAGHPGMLTEEAVTSGQLIADMCAAYLITARRADHSTRMIEAARSAINRNAPIEQAKGYLACHFETTPVQAYERLRTYARTHHLRSLEVATRILDGALDPGELAD